MTPFTTQETWTPTEAEMHNAAKILAALLDCPAEQRMNSVAAALVVAFKKDLFNK